MEHSIYRIIVDDIKQKINDNIYQYKEKLPPEAELMIMYNTSKATVRKAIKTLCDDGYVTNMPHMGNYINQPDTNNYILYFDEIESSIDIDNSEILSIEFYKNRDDFNEIIFSQKKVLEIKTIYKSYEIPVAFEIKYIFFKSANIKNAKKQNYDKILNILKKQLILFGINKKMSIYSCPAGEDAASHLHVKKDDYIICVEYFFTDKYEKIVAYYKTYYRTAYFRLNAISK